MRVKSWFVLLAVTALAVAAALWLVAARDERLAERVYGEPLYPGLAARVNDIAELGFDTGLDQWTIRREGEDRTWLVESRFDIRKDPTAWLDKTLLKIERARIREVVVEHPGGETLRLKRNPYGDLRPVDMPEGRVTEDIRLTAAQRSLEFLPFADVRPADEVDMSGAVETTYRADNGMVVTVRTKEAGFETDGDPAYWVTFDIRHDPDSVSTEADMPELTGPDEEKPVIDPEEGAERAQTAMERAEGWAYLFAEFTAQNFIHRMETVTSPKEES